MQNDKELFNLIKKSYPLEPNEEFEVKTLKMLQQKARNTHTEKKNNLFIFAAGFCLLCTFFVTWLILQTENIDRIQAPSLNALEEEKQLANFKEEPVIFIYHTYNFSSFSPELASSKSADEYHEEINVTLVGKRISESLNSNGIITIHDQTNHMGDKGSDQQYSMADSPEKARKTLSQAVQKNKHLRLVVDIRRDLQKREVTTVDINGVNYSRIAFNVSRSSGSYEKNVRLAEKFHEEIEAMYPGLSRGVFITDAKGEGMLNQDISKQSVTVLIGGSENSLEEEYRTGEIFANMIADIF